MFVAILCSFRLTQCLPHDGSLRGYLSQVKGRIRFFYLLVDCRFINVKCTSCSVLLLLFGWTHRCFAAGWFKCFHHVDISSHIQSTVFTRIVWLRGDLIQGGRGDRGVNAPINSDLKIQEFETNRQISFRGRL